MTFQVKDLLKSEIIFGREKSNINFEENIKTMSQITFKGSPINTVGALPEVGTIAQEFTLVAADLSEKHLADYTGKKVLLNIFPSIVQVFAQHLRESLIKKRVLWKIQLLSMFLEICLSH